MKFDASVKELQKAIKDLEKASKKAAKQKMPKVTSTNQIDMFAVAPAPSNDIDAAALKKQIDVAISSIETLIKQSA